MHAESRFFSIQFVLRFLSLFFSKLLIIENLARNHTFCAIQLIAHHGNLQNFTAFIKDPRMKSSSGVGGCFAIEMTVDDLVGGWSENRDFLDDVISGRPLNGNK